MLTASRVQRVTAQSGGIFHLPEPVATARDLTSTLSDSERRDFDTLFQLLDRADHFVVGFDPFGEGADDSARRRT